MTTLPYMVTETGWRGLQFSWLIHLGLAPPSINQVLPKVSDYIIESFL